jgi:hypothetical protein
MYLVTMEAHVAPELEEQLRRAYDHVMSHRPSGVVQSMLTRAVDDRTLWRIYTIWESHETLEGHYTSSLESDTLMPSVHVFHLVGIEPTGVGSEIIATDATAPSQSQQYDQNDAVS